MVYVPIDHIHLFDPHLHSHVKPQTPCNSPSFLKPQSPAAELRASTFAFLERVASYPGVDTVLIARVRILYIRSLIQQSPELKDAVAAPLESFLVVPDFSANPNPNPEVPPGALPPNEGFRIDVHLRPAMKRKKSFGFIKEKKGEPEPHLVDGKAEQVKQDAKIYATGNKVRVLGFVTALLVLLFGWCRGAGVGEAEQAKWDAKICAARNQGGIKISRVACDDGALLFCSIFDSGRPRGVWGGVECIFSIDRLSTRRPKAPEDACYGSECGQSLGGCFGLQKLGRSEASESAGQ